MVVRVFKMVGKMLRQERIKAVAMYVLGAILSVGIAAWVLKLWDAKLNIPWGYTADQLFSAVIVKTIIDNGWVWHNSLIGMPSGMDIYDFPSYNNLDYLIIKAIALFTSDYASVLNLFFLLTFPLATITAIYALRRFRLSWPPAILGGLLFTFVPFHFLRGEGHLFLASYMTVPLACMMILWVFEDASPLFGYSKGKGVLKSGLSPKFLGCALICVLVGSSFIYYPFFTCFFLLVAGILSAIAYRSKWPAVNASVLILLTVGIILINTSPTIIYHLFNGSNPEVGVRNPMEAEVFGLKIVQLFIPVEGHHIPFFATIASLYNSHFPLVNENSMASLGIIGCLGFLILVGWLLYRKAGGSEGILAGHVKEIDALSMLNFSAVLLATIGGFGTLFNIAVSSQLRCYNRISIFIAFFSLATMMIVADSLYKRYAGDLKIRKVAYLCFAIILVAGVLDQTTPLFAPPYGQIEEEVASDTAFVGQIEAIESSGAMIFQLPYAGFPESVPSANMTDYDHFRAYLSSDDLRWSYGAMKGRESDLWQNAVASMEVPEMVRNLAMAGFSGIYVDSYGYNDSGRSIIGNLSAALGVQPIVSKNNRLYFLDMTPYNEKLRANYSQEEWSLIVDRASHPVTGSWKGGFYKQEDSWDRTGRWCASSGELWINNPWNSDRNVTIEMTLSTGYADLANLDIGGPMVADRLEINNTPVKLSLTFTLKPGTSEISFNCDAKPVAVPDNPRSFVFRVDDFRIIDNY
jgi:phosphoglycerol transferase